MRFGIFDHMEMRGIPLHQQYEERLRLLERADAAGFWCYHKAEHHFVPLDSAPSANLFLAAAAQRTSRIRFGPLVALLPFYNPIRLIEEVCALDHLSHGRVEYGVGKGISPPEHNLWGHGADAARELFDETFAVLRAGLGADVLNYEGSHYRYRDVPMPMKPFQEPRPPLWYPGNVEYAGAHRLNTVIGGTAPEAAKALARYRELAAACTEEDNFNPGVAEPTVGIIRHVYVAETDDEARAVATRAYKPYNENVAVLFKKYDVPFPDPSNGDPEVAFQIEAVVAGSPDTLREQIEYTLETTGLDYIVCAFAWGDLSDAEYMASLDLFSNEVMPHFAGN